MNISRSALVAAGVALSAFLVVATLVIELASSTLAFSVLVGIPVGFVAAVVAGVATNRRYGSFAPGRRRLVEFIAGFGYSVAALGALRYAVPPTRPLLGFETVLAVAVVVSLALAVRSVVEQSP
ncbi:hypothetical protein AUR64_06045 [Haloprofundus marisrubri]|uniref:DUF8147 domain-containing protein n=1 Tax=Haloprofundus marisrubri TaxID=1514971 RepID=A0A0W1RDP7_9EURY|nr:hypothetical protein [Haloprofundus marisrubri]KTG10749.1 hypothetical protein AUR64_06045 [Haloprofundus marisrubri]